MGGVVKIVGKRGTLSNSTITGWEDTDPEAAAEAWSQTRALPVSWMELAEHYAEGTLVRRRRHPGESHLTQGHLIDGDREKATQTNCGITK